MLTIFIYPQTTPYAAPVAVHQRDGAYNAMLCQQVIADPSDILAERDVWVNTEKICPHCSNSNYT